MPEALRIIDKLDKIGLEKVQKQLQELLPTSDVSLLSLLSFKGPFINFIKQAPSWLLETSGILALQETLAFLQETFTNTDFFSFCPAMVRGLDYYTGLVFETFLTEHAEFGSIASGGRYNKLIDSIVNETTSLEGFGGSIGLTRLFDVLKKKNLLPDAPCPPSTVLIAYREAKEQKEAFVLANLLRKHGLSVDLYLGKGSIKKQLSYADKKEIPFVFILMGESYVIKDLVHSTQSEDLFDIEQAIQTLLSFKKIF